MKSIISYALFPAALLLSASAFHTAAATQVIIDNGNSTLSKEAARQSGEQWNDTRTLRNKVNQRTEKEFDKQGNAIDGQEKCNASANFNAYWEPNTARCLDRRTGRPVAQ